MKHVVVIGGGAAGMMASITAARQGAKVTLIEQNEKLGKKLFITGKGRCNITNASDMEVVFENVCTNRRFLYSAFYSFDNQMTMDFFQSIGLEMKIERGNRVFPLSDHSGDVIDVLRNEMRRLGVRILLNTKVKGLSQVTDESGSYIQQVTMDKAESIAGDAFVVATGGLSYPSTGSTGDGYSFAKGSGHKVTSCRPALVPLMVLESEVGFLQGLSLKNVTATICNGRKVLYSDFGEMLFTHFGVSGPLMLSASSKVSKLLPDTQLRLVIDLKPALTKEQLHKRILREFEGAQNKQFKNVVSSLLPARLVPVMISRSKISPNKVINEITKEERAAFVKEMKEFEWTIIGTRGYNEAIVTQGGVTVKEVEPSTMKSKLVNNLYFAGEILDLDAMTGGYNLQIAWSTGYLAGMNAAYEQNGE